jgi:hypothetical protein
MVAALCLVVNRMLTSEQRDVVIGLLVPLVDSDRSSARWWAIEYRGTGDHEKRLVVDYTERADFYQSIIDELQNGENA